MKYILLIIGLVLSNYSIAQESIKSIISIPTKTTNQNQFVIQNLQNVDSLDVIGYEDFREGLDGNNSSLDRLDYKRKRW